ncbi:MAG TPA: MFS transporter [Polyangiaceae bacterium]|nr:MFS transporter [Polyangiaceae bacterium]
MNTPAKLGLLGSLYFTQGLPFGFFTQALPVILRNQGATLGEIGLTSLLAVPWALKFLWAPVVDRYSSQRVGRRKSWILPLQVVAVLVLAALASSSVTSALPLLLCAVFVLNLIAATQDIATDGLAVDMLAPPERGLANGVQVAGYRVGMIVGGGVLLILHERLGMSGTFASMAALTALATVPLLATREAPSAHREVSGTSLHFLRRPGALRLLALIMAYKAGDAFGGAMLRPLLVDAGLSLSDIGWLLGTVGFVAGMAGAVCGGALVNRLGRRTALLGFGVLQTAAVASFAYLALAKPGMAALYVLCGSEHFVGGMATAALFTCMMDWSSRESSATDYTVQASAVVIATGAASAVGGYSAELLGYAGHFFLAALASAAALLLVWRKFPSSAELAALHGKGATACA